MPDEKSGASKSPAACALPSAESSSMAAIFSPHPQQLQVGPLLVGMHAHYPNQLGAAGMLRILEARKRVGGLYVKCISYKSRYPFFYGKPVGRTRGGWGGSARRLTRGCNHKRFIHKY